MSRDVDGNRDRSGEGLIGFGLYYLVFRFFSVLFTLGITGWLVFSRAGLEG